MFLLDINYILDSITGRSVNSDRYNKLLMELINSDIACISVSSIATIEYVIKKNYKNSIEKFNGLLTELQKVKTPSYIDLSSPLAKKDLEDYLIELSAKSISATVLTGDKDFIKISDIAVHPDMILEKGIDYKDNKINFIDLKRQYQNIYSEVERNIDRVMNHGQYIMGPEIAEFEAKLAKFAGTKYCYTVSDGTKALLIAMMALGIKGGN